MGRAFDAMENAIKSEQTNWLDVAGLAVALGLVLLFLAAA